MRQFPLQIWACRGKIVEKYRVCSKCGRRADGDEKFCTECGGEIAEKVQE